jgi:D-sedoheptulose 7-phosphate isomerase
MKLKNYTSYVSKTLEDINEENIEEVIKTITDSYDQNRMIFIIGNGGSAAAATHFAQDLSKGTRLNLDVVKRIKAMSLTDNLSFITALGNDDGYDTVFEQQLRTFSDRGDLLIAISGSGNSPNIIKAIEWANDNGIKTIGFTGFDGGKLKVLNSINVHVPLDDMETVESIHAIIFHYIILRLKEIVFDNN